MVSLSVIRSSSLTFRVRRDPKPIRGKMIGFHVKVKIFYFWLIGGWHIQDCVTLQSSADSPHISKRDARQSTVVSGQHPEPLFLYIKISRTVSDRRCPDAYLTEFNKKGYKNSSLNRLNLEKSVTSF